MPNWTAWTRILLTINLLQEPRLHIANIIENTRWCKVRTLRSAFNSAEDIAFVQHYQSCSWVIPMRTKQGFGFESCRSCACVRCRIHDHFIFELIPNSLTGPPKAQTVDMIMISSLLAPNVTRLARLQACNEPWHFSRNSWTESFDTCPGKKTEGIAVVCVD